MYKINKKTTDLVKFFEGLHDGDLSQIGLQPKLCPAGIWTEGYGRAMIDPRTGGHLRGIKNKALALKYRTIHTEEQAVEALAQDLKRYAGYATNALGIDLFNSLNANQQGALTSFVYNCGIGKPPYRIFHNINMFTKGKMTKDQLIEYWQNSVVKGGGKKLLGLVHRRNMEADLFFDSNIK
jgi:lysozyme